MKTAPCVVQVLGRVCSGGTEGTVQRGGTSARCGTDSLEGTGPRGPQWRVGTATGDFLLGEMGGSLQRRPRSYALRACGSVTAFILLTLIETSALPSSPSLELRVCEWCSPSPRLHVLWPQHPAPAAGGGAPWEERWSPPGSICPTTHFLSDDDDVCTWTRCFLVCDMQSGQTVVRPLAPEERELTFNPITKCLL